MKKSIIFVLAMCLFAAPAMAAVDITCSDDGSGVVTVSWDRNSEPNLVRAFALDITVDNGATITAVNDVNVDYYIYPGSIVIVNGAVTEDGSPVGDSNYPGTLGGLGTGGITVEMGSLYVGGANAPDDSGVLLTFTVDGDCNVTVAENAIRGGVVLEDPTVGDANLPIVYGVQIVTCWTASECPGQSLGDATCNGAVNLGDLFALKAAWGKSAPWTPPYCCCDFNHSGAVNLGDLFILKGNWGTSYGASTGNQNCP